MIGKFLKNIILAAVILGSGLLLYALFTSYTALKKHQSALAADQELIFISDEILEATPEAKSGHYLYWLKGHWFEYPKEYRVSKTRKHVRHSPDEKTFSKEIYLSNLSTNAERTGYDIETGRYNAALQKKLEIPRVFSFCRREGGNATREGIPPACNETERYEWIRKGAVQVTIISPFLTDFEDSFDFRIFEVALSRVKTGRLAPLEETDFSKFESKSKGSAVPKIAFFDEHKDMFATMNCNPSSRQFISNFYACFASVWDKSTNLAFKLEYGSQGSPKALAHEWKELADEANALLTEFHIGKAE